MLVDGAHHQLDLITAEAARRRFRVHIVIDFVHVLEKLWAAAWSLHPPAAPAAEDWVAGHALALLAGHTGQVITTLTAQAATAGAQHRDGIDACIRYLSNNAGHLRYDQALEAGWPIATGVIEGACRHLIADRFDLAGARWGRGGAEAPRAGHQRSSGGVLDFPSRQATRTRPPDRLPGRIRPHGLIASVTQEEPHPSDFRAAITSRP